MISLLVGIAILIAIFGVFYFIRIYTTPTTPQIEEIVKIVPKVEISGDVKKEDVVLALLTENGSGRNDYALLWNGTPNKSYKYIISHSGLEIAKGDLSSTSSVFKIRGLPLEQGKTYDVQVGDTYLKIPFTPPLITSVNTSEGYLDVGTTTVPTNIEVIVNSVKIPLTECEIKIEPPGFGCKLPSSDHPTMVIYNGPNAVNILL